MPIPTVHGVCSAFGLIRSGAFPRSDDKSLDYSFNVGLSSRYRVVAG